MNDFNTTSSDKSAITNMNLEEWLPDLEGKVSLFLKQGTREAARDKKLVRGAGHGKPSNVS